MIWMPHALEQRCCVAGLRSEGVPSTFTAPGLGDGRIVRKTSSFGISNFSPIER
jgi:hypothetical protein